MDCPQYQSQSWLQALPEEACLPDDIKELCEFWSERSCGLACVSSALEFLTGIRVSQVRLFNQCVRNGGYSPKGWKHAELASVLASYGPEASACKLTASDCISHLRKGYLIIASVSHKLPEDGRQGGHLILLHGVISSSGKTEVCFMDPSRWGRDNSCVTEERLFKSFSGNGILIKRT